MDVVLRGEQRLIRPPVDGRGLYAAGILPGEVQIQPQAPGVVRQLLRLRLIQHRAVLGVQRIAVDAPETFEDGRLVALVALPEGQRLRGDLLGVGADGVEIPGGDEPDIVARHKAAYGHPTGIVLRRVAVAGVVEDEEGDILAVTAVHREGHHPLRKAGAHHACPALRQGELVGAVGERGIGDLLCQEQLGKGVRKSPVVGREVVAAGGRYHRAVGQRRLKAHGASVQHVRRVGAAEARPFVDPAVSQQGAKRLVEGIVTVDGADDIAALHIVGDGVIPPGGAGIICQMYAAFRPVSLVDIAFRGGTARRQGEALKLHGITSVIVLTVVPSGGARGKNQQGAA